MPSSHDDLTGLMNRAALHEILEAALADSKQNKVSLGLILFDIDRFKLINYGFGDERGNTVLQAVAEAAKKKLTNGHWIGSWGGQQFLCLLPGCDHRAADAIAEQLRSLIATLTIPVESQAVQVTASFGVACFPEDGDLVQRLLAAAEAALYQAKESGRNRVVHASNLQQQVFGMGNMLDIALRENNIVPAYQSIIDLQTGKVVAEEALARLITREGKIIDAEEFIGVASQLQLTYKIDQAVMAHCLAILQGDPNLTHFVNISGNLLRHPEVVQELLACMQEYGASVNKPTKLPVIEITEREFLGDAKSANDMLQPLIDFGLRLALDDFGSGYSSFQYLADLPISFLKIEGSLIKRVTEPKVCAIVQGIQNTAADLGLVTLAECVENGEIAEIVQTIGINWAQGYFYNRPAFAAPISPNQIRL
jgi:diguanylate cyclase